MAASQNTRMQQMARDMGGKRPHDEYDHDDDRDRDHDEDYRKRGKNARYKGKCLHCGMSGHQWGACYQCCVHCGSHSHCAIRENLVIVEPAGRCPQLNRRLYEQHNYNPTREQIESDAREAAYGEMQDTIDDLIGQLAGIAGRLDAETARNSVLERQVVALQEQLQQQQGRARAPTQDPRLPQRPRREDRIG